MGRLLINGIYDGTTLKTLQYLGVKAFSFDLRGRSSNLIPFHQLKEILAHSSSFESSIIFENDKETTILSFLNLLKNAPASLTLQFRDQHLAAFYQKINFPFSWVFHPEGDWESIFSLPQLRSVLLPLKYESYYQNLPKMWEILSRSHIQVYLHAENQIELMKIMADDGVNISFDLGREFEKGFRSIDQERLKKLKIWRFRDENIAS